MLSHRFLSVLLLVCYGIPTSVGPHWHSHQHESPKEIACGADCCAHDAGHAKRAGRTADRAAPVPWPSKAGAHEVSPAWESQASRARVLGGDALSRRPLICELPGSRHCPEDCVIHAFYAQSQSNSIVYVCVSTSFLCGCVTPPRFSAESFEFPGFSARGPPAIACL